MKKVLILTTFIFGQWLNAQSLTSDFQKQEFINLLKLSMHQTDTPWMNTPVDLPEGYQLYFRSPMVGLENRFDLWLDTTAKIGAINVRGSNGTRPSWLENFYSAMIPAKGTIQLNDSTVFEYLLANNPKAAVHTGWLLGMAAIAPIVKQQIIKFYTSGYKDFYISGHSQGGAIATLLTAYLIKQKEIGELPFDINLKTYCSAGPKPGNLFFAYEYEQATQSGWSYNVVNPYDWVPQTPFSVQTVDDFSTTNPFTDAKKSIKELKFPIDMVARHIYNQLNKPTTKARKNFQKTLGNRAASIIIKKDLPQFQEPEYFDSMNYMRCGQQIILITDREYHEKYPDTKDDLFTHHRPQVYLYLSQKLED